MIDPSDGVVVVVLPVDVPVFVVASVGALAAGGVTMLPAVVGVVEPVEAVGLVVVAVVDATAGRAAAGPETALVAGFVVAARALLPLVDAVDVAVLAALATFLFAPDAAAFLAKMAASLELVVDPEEWPVTV